MSRSHELGRRGEDLAAALLRRDGWTILHRNWRFRHKEIDIVAERAGMVAFVEVKTRAGRRFGHPLDAVTASKRRDLAAAARVWVERHGRARQSYRFDAIWVLTENGTTRVQHIQDAWRL